MSAITVEVPSARVDLDACRECQFIWFDRGEYETLPVAPVDTVRSLGETKVPKNLSIEDLIIAASTPDPPASEQSMLEPDFQEMALMAAVGIIRLFLRV